VIQLLDGDIETVSGYLQSCSFQAWIVRVAVALGVALSITKTSSSEGRVGALYVPGLQLVVISNCKGTVTFVTTSGQSFDVIERVFE
jgi:hypothetical protein